MVCDRCFRQQRPATSAANSTVPLFSLKRRTTSSNRNLDAAVGWDALRRWCRIPRATITRATHKTSKPPGGNKRGSHGADVGDRKEPQRYGRTAARRLFRYRGQSCAQRGRCHPAGRPADTPGVSGSRRGHCRQSQQVRRLSFARLSATAIGSRAESDGESKKQTQHGLLLDLTTDRFARALALGGQALVKMLSPPDR